METTRSAFCDLARRPRAHGVDHSTLYSSTTLVQNEGVPHKAEQFYAVR
jgi:hypothetical protein